MDAKYFDEWYAGIGASAADERFFTEALGVPVEVGPQNLVPLAGLRQIAAALAAEPGGLLVDIACGRGGPGMWLARELDLELLGVDFSAEAVRQATKRRSRFGLTERATFAVGTFDSTGLAAGAADAVVCIDAFQFSSDRVKAAEEMRRLLRPGGRVVLTGWEPKQPGDDELPERMRDLDFGAALDAAGFTDVVRTLKPEWDEVEHALWTQAAALDPGDDPALVSTKEEAEQALPLFDRRHRVMATAVAP
ncbi:MAG: class I SAM-dependent methyltransferase [Frankiaceae bacterium]|nr:class I SAM-dependent methyltransferase [Frankiaceae bacterium]MBV9873071.1 class I SAM-dependent methyltransferase [Frankiaceae bacterium]